MWWRPIWEWVKREAPNHPELMKILEEQAGPYGPAIRETEKKAIDQLKPEPKERERGAEHPFFPLGIFSHTRESSAIWNTLHL